jgi:hypothetical protein
LAEKETSGGGNDRKYDISCIIYVRLVHRATQKKVSHWQHVCNGTDCKAFTAVNSIVTSENETNTKSCDCSLNVKSAAGVAHR